MPHDLLAHRALAFRLAVAPGLWHLEGAEGVVESDPPHRARWNGQAAAGAKARIAYDLTENGGGTRFDYENEFELPAGKVGKLAGRAFNAVSGDREAKRTLARLKALLENAGDDR